MPLHGKGMLVVYTEVKPRDERDFNEWYNREHIDERVNLPGFHRARRYVAERGAPKYLATYECDHVGDLATPGYLNLLANQTPWSQSVMARFTTFHRMTLRVQVDLTHGVGGAVTTVRFVPDPRKRRLMTDWLSRMAAVGCGVLPSARRSVLRSRSCKRSQVPSALQRVNQP